jgi:hypothetical protein
MVCIAFETGKFKVSLPGLPGLDLRQKREKFLEVRENHWRNGPMRRRQEGGLKLV